jgi:hypothetical protein
VEKLKKETLPIVIVRAKEIPHLSQFFCYFAGNY